MLSIGYPHTLPPTYNSLYLLQESCVWVFFSCVGPIRVADRRSAKGNWLFINASDDLIEPRVSPVKQSRRWQLCSFYEEPLGEIRLDFADLRDFYLIICVTLCVFITRTLE